MNPNPRLTKVIKGHPITDVENAHGTLTVRFENATWMRLRITLDSSSSVPQGAKVVEALESQGRFALRLDDGSTVAFALSDPSSVVSVWTEAGKLLYLG